MMPSRPSSAPPARTRREGVRLALLRLLGRCYPRSQPTSAPRNILLVRPDHVGDMLFLTPALHALRRTLPAARITLLSGPWGRGVVAGNPDLDAVETCHFPGFERQPKKGPLAPYRALFKTARMLAAGDYDTAVIFRFDHWWGAWLAAAAGIPRRIGYDWPETRPFLTQAAPYRGDRHEVEQNAALAAALAPGLDRQMGPTRYVVAAEDAAWAAAWLAAHGRAPGRPLIAIHPGAGAAVKQWPLVAWAAVADGLNSTFGAQILLTGAANERSLTQTLGAALRRPALDSAGATTLGQLAALQAHCALVLGSDSGPLHLAVAVGAPTVHLYGPVAHTKFGPWGDLARHVVLTTDWACAPCNQLDWPAAVLAQHQCMAAILPERVLAAAEILLTR